MAFSFYRTITVNSGQASGTQSSFPMLVAGTYNGSGGIADLRTAGNGGKVQNSSGFDVGFYSDAALTTKLNWETEKYTASTGVVAYWVNVSSLADGTVIYMAYGDAGITTDQSNKTAVWDSNFTGVWHLADNAASTTVLDSIASGHNGTNSVNTSTRTIAGEIAGGLDYQGGDQTDMGNVLNTSWGTGVSFTLETWIKFNAASSGSKAGFITKTGNAVPGPIFSYRSNAGNRLYYEGYDGTRNPFGYNSTALSTGVWYHVAYVRDVAATTGRFYVNGVADGTLTDNTTDMGSASDNFHLGGDTSNGVRITAYMDEARVSNTNRSAAWLLTSYNNQVAPGTFYTVGSETTTSATTTKTETGVARVQKSVSQTITGKGRITATTTKTETGVARIQKAATQTETGVARVTATTTKTETGTARIQKSTTRTETGVARVTVSTTKTETGVARITASTTKTETGVANILVTGTTSRTITGVARLQKAVTKTETGVANILVSVTTTKTETGKARVTNSTSQTETGKADISKTTMRTITGTARIGTLGQVQIGPGVILNSKSDNNVVLKTLRY